MDRRACEPPTRNDGYRVPARHVDELLGRAGQGRMASAYGARDEEHNNTVVLREYLQERLSR